VFKLAEIKKPKKLIMTFFKKYILYFILIVLALFFVIIWRLDNNPGSLSDFGLNAFTELLGIIITIAIVENIIKKQNEKAILPIKAAIYRDIQLFASRIIGFWYDVHFESVPEDDPKNIEELFSANTFEKMLNYLSLDGEPKVYPKTNWWQLFASQGKDIE
jgi:hypothetical protein